MASTARILAGTNTVSRAPFRATLYERLVTPDTPETICARLTRRIAGSVVLVAYRAQRGGRSSWIGTGLTFADDANSGLLNHRERTRLETTELESVMPSGERTRSVENARVGDTLGVQGEIVGVDGSDIQREVILSAGVCVCGFEESGATSTRSGSDANGQV